MSFRVQYLAVVVDEDIPSLSPEWKNRIRRAIETKLTRDPVAFGKPLQYSLRGCRRLRVGDYRVIFYIELPETVVIVKIGHRREVCE